MRPFPSINQFRDVIKKIQRKAAFIGLDDGGNPILNSAPALPSLRFKGSVKLHGTNAGIVFENGGVVFQSRERELSHEQDNAGFFNHMQDHLPALGGVADLIRLQAIEADSDDDVIAIYGEWCGGNIQKSVALNGLPKMFVVFAIRVNDQWQDIDQFNWLSDPEASIFNITQFEQFDIEIDFARPEIAQNALGSITEKVEARCPVGAHFGIDGVGEGVVWRCVEDPSSDYWFKVKGEKHSASKVKTLASVDVESIERLRDFVTIAVTDARLEQGLQNLVNEQLKPFEMTSMGDFIRWVFNDVVKEEGDTIEANGFDTKKLGGPIAAVARSWYVQRLNAA